MMNNENKLNQHLSGIDAQAELQSLIEKHSLKFYDELLAGLIVKIGGVNYHFNSFIQDLEIEDYKFLQLAIGDSEPLQGFITNSLNDYCIDLAKEHIELNNI